MSMSEAIILGAIQGIAEWLPVSSSGHLALYEQFADIETPLTFNVLLHFSSLAVIFIIFRKQIRTVLRSSRYMRNIILGSIPIAFAGFYGRNFVELSCVRPRIIATSLILTGIFLALTRFASEKRRNVRPGSSFLIGIAQSFALIPGISRSGITVSTGILLGIDSKTAAEFSFMLAIPAIIGATAFELVAARSFSQALSPPFLTGMLISFALGYFCLSLLLDIIRKGKLHWFSLYCLVAGGILMFLGGRT